MTVAKSGSLNSTTTLTTRDSLMPFLRHSVGSTRFALGLGAMSPVLGEAQAASLGVNLVRLAGISVEEAHRMCSLYPAQVLGCGEAYGKIATGYKAQMVALNNELQLVGVISEEY